MLGCGSHSVLMVPDGSPGCEVQSGAGRTSTTDARSGCIRAGDAPPELPFRSGRCEALLSARPRQVGRPQPTRPRGLRAVRSASRRAFCRADGPLGRPPLCLPVAHHRLQLPVGLPQHLVARQFTVLLRAPAAHAR